METRETITTKELIMDNLNPFEPIEESRTTRNKTVSLGQRKFLIAIGVILLVEAPQVIGSWITIAEKMPLLRHQYSSLIQVIEQAEK